MKLGSLFSGVGGFELGFEEAGFETVWQCEIDPFARRVLEHRWPVVPCYEDIRGVDAGELVRPDVITAGFPCQDLSVAGKRAGLGGDRSGLFWEIVRICDGLRPAWLVLENVPGLLSSNEGRDFAAVVDALVELGYGLAWRVLDAQYFGVPQRRRRVFVVGCLGDPGRAGQVLFEPEGVPGNSESSGEAGEGAATYVVKGAAVGREPHNGPQYGEVLDDGTCFTLNTVETQCVSTNALFFDTTQITSNENRSKPEPGDPCHPIAAEGHAPAVAFHPTQTPVNGAQSPALGTTSRGMGVALDMAIRRLTPLECERLMGWPDGHTAIPGASDSARYRSCGNGVVSPVSHWIANRIKEAS